MELHTPTSLDKILFRLIYEAPFREDFLMDRGWYKTLAPALRSELETIDRDQLKKTASRVLKNTLHGSAGKRGGLENAFPETLAWYRKAFPKDAGFEALMENFLASPVYASVQELPQGPQGICVEEGFFTFFAEAYPQVPSETLQHEFYSYLMKHLAVSPKPYFDIRANGIRTLPKGRFAVRESQEGFHLYAVAGGKYVQGPVTELIVGLLILSSKGTVNRLGPKLRERLNVDLTEYQTVLERLTDLALI